MSRSKAEEALIQSMMNNVWYPYTQMKSLTQPILIEKGLGSYLIDNNGKRYIDAISSWWVNVHGHCHPKIIQKVKAQIDQLDHTIFAGFCNEPAISLSEKLLRALPSNQKKIFYSDNGSTAVETALKLAIQYWQNLGTSKKTMISFKEAFHGDTFGAMSVSGKSIFSNPFLNHLFKVHQIDAPFPGKEEESLRQFRKIAEEDNPAAFIFEPLILGAAGMKMYEPGILDQLLQICSETNVLSIADEVMVGFGRTGKMFACDYLNKQPDMMCLSKGITGGVLPLAATSCTNRIFDAFLSNENDKTFFHGHSYTGNAIACAAANASMEIFENQQVWTKINSIHNQHISFGNSIREHPIIEDIRLRGTIIAIELKTDKESSYLNPISKSISSFFLERGILIRPLGNVIYIMPPYCIEEENLTIIYSAIKDFICQAH